MRQNTLRQTLLRGSEQCFGIITFGVVPGRYAETGELSQP
jgi:hypothetical protein